MSCETPLSQVLKVKNYHLKYRTKKGNMKKDYEKEDYNKRTTAGSGIAHTDPDPAKSYGSGRIRIRNTAIKSIWQLPQVIHRYHLSKGNASLH